jgi:HEAT repeat protein
LQKEKCEALCAYATQTKFGDLLLQKLFVLTNNADVIVRKWAADTLSRMGQLAATPEVLSRLMNLTKDGTGEVCRSAAIALSKLGKLAATPKLLSRLISLIDDVNEDVQRRAAITLSAMDKATGKSDLASQLITFWIRKLSDTNFDQITIESINDLAFRELSKIVSQLPPSFKWKEQSSNQ